MKFMSAKYDGVCSQCGDRVFRGDVIGYAGTAQHRACAGFPEAEPGDTVATARARAQEKNAAEDREFDLKTRVFRKAYEAGEVADIYVTGATLRVRNCGKAVALELAQATAANLSVATGVPHRLKSHRGTDGKRYTGRVVLVDRREDGYAYPLAIG